MHLKVTQNLTYLEARKQIEQTPLFNFSQVVKYFASKPETKTTATQYSDEDYKITERSKVLIAIKPNKTIRPQNQKSTSDQANANAKTNKPYQPSTNAKPHSASSRVRKGSASNSITNLELWHDDAMEMDEVTSRPGSRGYRPSRSPIKAPK